MKNKFLLSIICSALEYLVERGEIDLIQKVHTKCRYKPFSFIEEFIVETENGTLFRIFAEKVKK